MHVNSCPRAEEKNGWSPCMVLWPYGQGPQQLATLPEQRIRLRSVGSPWWRQPCYGARNPAASWRGAPVHRSASVQSTVCRGGVSAASHPAAKRHVGPLCQLVAQGAAHRCCQFLGGSLRNLSDHTAVAGTAARALCASVPRGPEARSRRSRSRWPTRRTRQLQAARTTLSRFPPVS